MSGYLIDFFDDNGDPLSLDAAHIVGVHPVYDIDKSTGSYVRTMDRTRITCVDGNDYAVAGNFQQIRQQVSAAKFELIKNGRRRPL